MLYLRVIWELLRYDCLFAWRGMQAVKPGKRKPTGFAQDRGDVDCGVIVEAVRSVTPFYWKPIRCLQRSVVTARVMRSAGLPAEIVIGYRLNPFLSHAWVEMDGHVVNDSPVYQRSLQVVERL